MTGSNSQGISFNNSNKLNDILIELVDTKNYITEIPPRIDVKFDQLWGNLNSRLSLITSILQAPVTITNAVKHIYKPFVGNNSIVLVREIVKYDSTTDMVASSVKQHSFDGLNWIDGLPTGGDVLLYAFNTINHIRVQGTDNALAGVYAEDATESNTIVNTLTLSPGSFHTCSIAVLSGSAEIYYNSDTIPHTLNEGYSRTIELTDFNIHELKILPNTTTSVIEITITK